MKKGLFALLLSILTQFSFAQSTIEIKVTNSYGLPIEDVEVRLIKNSEPIAQDLTNKNGLVSFKEVNSSESLFISASHVSYLSAHVELAADNGKQFVLVLQDKEELQPEALVLGVRARKNTPASFTNLNKKKVEQMNYGQDLPYVLQQTPNVLVHSDAGAGVGYTGMRIRGVDPTRINVTLNGIPVNDGESQGVFWVDLPDLASSVSSIQVQRGVGTSTNGSAAFGASINLSTDDVSQDPFGRLSLGYGSFNTQKLTAEFGTGRLDNGWGVQGRYSLIRSDGFIDRATSDLNSLSLTLAHYGEKGTFKLVHLKGFEETYQAWYGVPQPKFEQDKDGLDEFIADLYIAGEEEENLRNSDYNTYNPYTYKNEVDHYNQDYYQAFYQYALSNSSTVKFAGFYTRGYGYYEQFRSDDDFSTYGLNPIAIDSIVIENGDFIRRRWLDNHFYGGQVYYNHKLKKGQLDLGLNIQEYQGAHYGELIWAEFASNSTIGHRYYDNDAVKREASGYAKYLHRLTSQIHLFGDLQLRGVDYNFKGPDQDGTPIDREEGYLFINPKLGLSYFLSSKLRVYASYAIANREPVRSDFVDSSPDSKPSAERLDDIEIGSRYESRKGSFGATVYYMNYTDQLVLTGQINDVGGYTRENVDKSFRMGIELDGAYRFNDKLELAGNISISKNEISSYTEYVDDWFNGGQISNEYKNVELAFSPNYIGSLVLAYMPMKGLRLELIEKSVGTQYLDNTESDDRKLNPYDLLNFQASYSFKKEDKQAFELAFQLNNLLGTDYAPNGYTFGGMLGERRGSFNYVYPQAGRNYMLKATYAF